MLAASECNNASGNAIDIEAHNCNKQVQSVIDAEMHPNAMFALLQQKQRQTQLCKPPVAYTLLQTVMNDITHRIGQKFVLDCSAHDFAHTENDCKAVTTLQTVLNTDMAGCTSFVYASPQNTPVIMKHYLQCKAENPQDTNAVFVITRHVKDKCDKQLQDMQHIQTYKNTEKICQMHWLDAPSQRCPPPATLYVYYDGIIPNENIPSKSKQDILTPVIPQYVLKPTALSMVFDGKASGATAKIAVDSGAEGMGFISTAYVTKNQLKTHQVKAKIMLADGVTEMDCVQVGLLVTVYKNLIYAVYTVYTP